MKRRQFIVGAASVGLAGFALGATIRRTRLRMAVVGGGIVGAAIAMRCARAGAKVTVLEKVAPAAGATCKSFAWINPFVDDDHYMRMRLRALAGWQALDRGLGLGITWGGYVGFTDKEADRGRMALQCRHLAEAGHATRALDAAALAKASPEIRVEGLVEATASELGGHVDPVRATGRMLSAAAIAGARILHPCAVLGIDPMASGVALATDRGRMEFDHVVVATGVDAPAMLAPLGYRLPLLHRPGALVHSRPLRIITRHVYDGPGELEWKQAADGSIVGLEASNPPSIDVHADIRSHAIEFPPGIAQLHGERMLGKFSVYVPHLKGAQVGSVTLGFRPMPVDGFPVVGPVPGVAGVSLCVTHSGVTLAPLLGEFICNQVMEGADEPMLVPYRPTREMAAPPAA